MGWKDVVLLERKELTSGSSWHAAGIIHTINSDSNIARLQGYTINLYKELEELTSQSCGIHRPGGIYLASTKNKIPQLTRVIVSIGNQVVMDKTLWSAFNRLKQIYVKNAAQSDGTETPKAILNKPEKTKETK